MYVEFLGGCSFYVAVKYCLQISVSFIVPKNAVADSSADDMFAIATLNIMQKN